MKPLTVDRSRIVRAPTVRNSAACRKFFTTQAALPRMLRRAALRRHPVAYL